MPPSPSGAARPRAGGRTRARALAGRAAPALALAALIGPALADPGRAEAAGKRGKWDGSEGFEDPSRRSLPRTHRFRLAAESGYMRLSSAIDGRTGEAVAFHYAPLVLNLGYQAQFLRFVSARASVGVGGNVANSRAAMPMVLNPRAHLGYQGRWFGLLATYGYMFMFPGTIDATNPRIANGVEQPYLANVHQFGAEASITSRVDRVAYTFSVGMVGVRNDLCHLDFDCVRRIYPMVTLGAGLYFDGSGRRAARRKRAEKSP